MTEVILRTKPLNASFSKIKSYNKCGKAFQLQYAHKFPTPPAWYLLAGVALHRATEWWDLGEWINEPEDAFEQAFDEVIAEAEKDWPDQNVWLAAGWVNKQRESYWRSKGYDYMRQWADTPKPSKVPLHVEVDLSTTLPSGLVMKAYADRVYDGYGHMTIWDLKSGSSRPDDDSQLGIYAVLLKHMYPDVSVSAANYMFKDDKAYDVDVTHWLEGGLDLLDSIGQTWRTGVESGVFLPKRSADCERCWVADACYLQSGDTETTRQYDPLNPLYPQPIYPKYPKEKNG